MLPGLITGSAISLRSFLAPVRLATRGHAASLRSAAPKYGNLPTEQRQQADAFLDILLDWNARMNLTAVTDRQEALVRHIDDSLSLLPVIDACIEGSDAPVRIIDVGSGAGLPGMVLAIARPLWDVTLLDSLQKRCTFTREAAAAAGLSNVSVEWARAEDAGQDPRLREQHTVAVARAVAELRLLAELCLPLVAIGGHWVAAKGADPQGELEQARQAVHLLGGQAAAVHEVDSLGPQGRRTAVVVHKLRPTPAKYPRRSGLPKKQPL